jgi:hypothetical protein
MRRRIMRMNILAAGLECKSADKKVTGVPFNPLSMNTDTPDPFDHDSGYE